jgi:hypothetical protein
MSDAAFSVSTSPAFFTAVTSVDSTGLAEAAVATGAAAIPLKLPAPDFGTDEQAGPKSIAAAGAEDDAFGAAAGGAADDPLELQAASPSPRLAASADTARRRCFISFSFAIAVR